jgi:hypothetical protein
MPIAAMLKRRIICSAPAKETNVGFLLYTRHLMLSALGNDQYWSDVAVYIAGDFQV